MSMGDKKMAGKQEVVGGFDLASFVNASEPETVKKVEQPEAPKSVSKPVAPSKPAKPLVEVKKPAKVAKSASQAASKANLTERVQIRLTVAEMSELEKKCGLVPASTFLRNFLKENGLI